MNARRMISTFRARSISLLLPFCGFLGCYEGVADSERIQVLEVKVQSQDHAAMLVKVSSRLAFVGDEYYVLLGTHPYSMPELRHNLYGFKPVFKVGRGNIGVEWSAPHVLTIACNSCDITHDIIEKQLYSQGGVTIKYDGFP